jgi:hypothetical protein
MDELSGSATTQTRPVDPSYLLYHYTDQNGLLGIINKGSIWATHYQYLNDTSEFQKAKEILFSLLKRYSQDEVDEGRKGYWQKIEEIVEEVHKNFCVYIASFTSSKNIYFSDDGIEHKDESDPGDRLRAYP